MTNHYQVRMRGRIVGPFTLEGLRQMTRRGLVGRAHEVSRDGISWAKATDFPEIFAAGPPVFRQSSDSDALMDDGVELPPVIESRFPSLPDATASFPLAPAGRNANAWEFREVAIGVAALFAAVAGLLLLSAPRANSSRADREQNPGGEQVAVTAPRAGLRNGASLSGSKEQPQAAKSSLADSATPMESVPDPRRQPAASNEATVESARLKRLESAVVGASRRPGHQDKLTAVDILAEAKKPVEKRASVAIPAFDSAGSAVTLVSWTTPASPALLERISLDLPVLADMPSHYQLVLTKSGSAGAESGAVSWQCGTAGKPAGVGTFTLTGTALRFAYADEPAAGHGLLPLVPVRMSESGTSGKALVIEPPLLASGAFGVNDDAAVVVLPQAASPSPEACAALSGRLRIADATLGLGFSPDVVVEAAAMGDKPRFAGGASLPVTEGPAMQVWWRPAIGAGSAAGVREPLAIRTELQPGVHDGEASAGGMRIVMRLDQRIADPMPAVLAKLSPPAAQKLRLFLESADPAARVGAAANVPPADVVQWLARFAFHADAADDSPYGELREWLKNRWQKRQGQREDNPKSRVDSSLYADVVNDIKVYIQEREAYRSHVDHAVKAALAKDWPAGRPPEPGKLPEPPRPDDAVDKQRYDREIAAWKKQEGQVRAYEAERDRLDSHVRADAADFRSWVHRIVTPASGAGHQNEGVDDADRRLAELWRMVHVYGLLRQGGLPVPTAAVNEPRDAAAQAGCLHVNRFKGLVQLRWKFPSDMARDELIFTTLAELDLSTGGEMRRQRTGSLSAVGRPLLARAILSQDKVTGFVTTAVSLRPGVSSCH